MSNPQLWPLPAPPNGVSPAALFNPDGRVLPMPAAIGRQIAAAVQAVSMGSGSTAVEAADPKSSSAACAVIAIKPGGDLTTALSMGPGAGSCDLDRFSVMCSKHLIAGLLLVPEHAVKTLIMENATAARETNQFYLLQHMMLLCRQVLIEKGVPMSMISTEANLQRFKASSKHHEVQAALATLWQTPSPGDHFRPVPANSNKNKCNKNLSTALAGLTMQLLELSFTPEWPTIQRGLLWCDRSTMTVLWTVFHARAKIRSSNEASPWRFFFLGVETAVHYKASTISNVWEKALKKAINSPAAAAMLQHAHLHPASAGQTLQQSNPQKVKAVETSFKQEAVSLTLGEPHSGAQVAQLAQMDTDALSAVLRKMKSAETAAKTTATKTRNKQMDYSTDSGPSFHRKKADRSEVVSKKTDSSEVVSVTAKPQLSSDELHGDDEASLPNGDDAVEEAADDPSVIGTSADDDDEEDFADDQESAPPPPQQQQQQVTPSTRSVSPIHARAQISPQFEIRSLYYIAEPAEFKAAVECTIKIGTFPNVQATSFAVAMARGDMYQELVANMMPRPGDPAVPGLPVHYGHIRHKDPLQSSATVREFVCGQLLSDLMNSSHSINTGLPNGFKSFRESFLRCASDSKPPSVDPSEEEAKLLVQEATKGMESASKKRGRGSSAARHAAQAQVEQANKALRQAQLQSQLKNLEEQASVATANENHDLFSELQRESATVHEQLLDFMPPPGEDIADVRAARANNRVVVATHCAAAVVSLHDRRLLHRQLSSSSFTVVHSIVLKQMQLQKMMPVGQGDSDQSAALSVGHLLAVDCFHTAATAKSEGRMPSFSNMRVVLVPSNSVRIVGLESSSEEHAQDAASNPALWFDNAAVNRAQEFFSPLLNGFQPADFVQPDDAAKDIFYDSFGVAITVIESLAACPLTLAISDNIDRVVEHFRSWMKEYVAFFSDHRQSCEPPSALIFFENARFNALHDQEANPGRKQSKPDQFVYMGASPRYSVEWCDGMADVTPALRRWPELRATLFNAMAPSISARALNAIGFSSKTSARDIHVALTNARDRKGQTSSAAQIGQVLDRCGRTMVKMPGDGDCLFYAMRHCLQQLPEDSKVNKDHPFYEASMLKQNSGESHEDFQDRHIRAQRAALADLLQRTSPNCTDLTALRQPGYWDVGGMDFAVDQLALALNLKVLVLWDRPSNPQLPTVLNRHADGPTIVLVYRTQGHFDGSSISGSDKTEDYVAKLITDLGGSAADLPQLVHPSAPANDSATVVEDAAAPDESMGEVKDATEQPVSTPPHSPLAGPSEAQEKKQEESLPEEEAQPEQQEPGSPEQNNRKPKRKPSSRKPSKRPKKPKH